MIVTILSTLLVASLCATGAAFLKCLEAKNEVERLKKENVGIAKTKLAVETELVKVQRQFAESQAVYDPKMPLPRRDPNTLDL